MQSDEAGRARPEMAAAPTEDDFCLSASLNAHSVCLELQSADVTSTPPPPPSPLCSIAGRGSHGGASVRLPGLHPNTSGHNSSLIPDIRGRPESAPRLAALSCRKTSRTLALCFFWGLWEQSLHFFCPWKDSDPLLNYFQAFPVGF